jgi:hypothetical protein
VVVLNLGRVANIRFPSLPEGLITRPTLRWLVESSQTGAQDVELTYLTNGMTWTADYILLLADDKTSLDLDGWITLSNTSGGSYENAQLKLIAGDVNRVSTMTGSFAPTGTPLPTATLDYFGDNTAVAQREFFEYQLYEIERPVTIADKETKQVEFIGESAIPATVYYVFSVSPPFYGYSYAYTDPQYGALSAVSAVQTYLNFTTDEDEGGVGRDLPAGRAWIYQNDADGTAQFIGQRQIDHTPEGEELDLFLGGAFNLLGQRKQTDFQLSGGFNPLRRFDVLTETIEIRLINFKDDETVEIRIPERMTRWSDWEIVEASTDYTQIDSSTIEFRVEIPPRSQQVITYTVRYGIPR